jgi:hypothetical protein
MVLAFGIGDVVCAFHFYAHGKVVAGVAACEDGLARVPGTPVERDELLQIPVAADEQVRGDAKVSHGPEKGMSGGLETAEEQILDPGSAEDVRWQADVVDYQQADIRRVRSVVAMG